MFSVGVPRYFLMGHGVKWLMASKIKLNPLVVVVIV
jgi:hypothetical protein